MIEQADSKNTQIAIGVHIVRLATNVIWCSLLLPWFSGRPLGDDTREGGRAASREFGHHPDLYKGYVFLSIQINDTFRDSPYGFRRFVDRPI